MKKILVVDDNEANLTMINGMLNSSYKVYLVNSGADALNFLKVILPNLILLDVKMPEMSGIELIRTIKASKELSDIPVIFLTGLNDVENEATAFDFGAVDYIHKPVNNVVLKARVKLHLELEAYRRVLQNLVKSKTSEILQLQKITIDLLARASEFRDSDTGNHEKRTVRYVCAIMDSLPNELPPSYHISNEYYNDIKKSTPLHDIGKISIPDSILLKSGKLTDEEYEIMKGHVASGVELLRDAIAEFNGPSFLDVSLEMVLTHHEKWNGTGYPNKLAGECIPISGRIMAIADVYDALTSRRPYKSPLSHTQAMTIIAESSGSHFDSVLVETFMRIQDDIFKIAQKYKMDEK